ncbi:hypothetical protein R3P38DRAFT_2911049 [Favolaschia claudopus]|uniref:DUF6699 domain-containing protein n=1 Tax=Favolaschia claudopus TaxID=2862362 RepID=A0AAW0CD28_9AGAR
MSKQSNVRFDPNAVVHEAPARPSTQSTDKHSTLDPALTAKGCLSLDFSLPAAIVKEHFKLDDDVLNRAASQPHAARLCVRVPYPTGSRGLCIVDIRPCVPERRYVSVGDVLTQVHKKLRDPPDGDAAKEDGLPDVFEKRVRFFETYAYASGAPDPSVSVRAERAGGVRRVDCLRGKVVFAGLTYKTEVFEANTRVEIWQLDLDLAPRYAHA